MLFLSPLPPAPQADIPCWHCLWHLLNWQTILFACVDYFAYRGKFTKKKLRKFTKFTLLFIVNDLPPKDFNFSLLLLLRYFKTYSVYCLWEFFKVFSPSPSGFQPLRCSPKDASNPFMMISALCRFFHLLHPCRIRIHQSSCKDTVNSIVASPFLLLGLWPCSYMIKIFFFRVSFKLEPVSLCSFYMYLFCWCFKMFSLGQWCESD